MTLESQKLQEFLLATQNIYKRLINKTVFATRDYDALKCEVCLVSVQRVPVFARYLSPTHKHEPCAN